MTSSSVLAAGTALAAALLAAPVPSTEPVRTSTPGSGGVTWAVRPAGPKGPSGRDYFVYSVSPG